MLNFQWVNKKSNTKFYFIQFLPQSCQNLEWSKQELERPIYSIFLTTDSPYYAVWQLKIFKHIAGHINFSLDTVYMLYLYCLVKIQKIFSTDIILPFLNIIKLLLVILQSVTLSPTLLSCLTVACIVAVPKDSKNMVLLWSPQTKDPLLFWV